MQFHQLKLPTLMHVRTSTNISIALRPPKSL